MSTTRIPKAEITGLYGALAKRFSKKLLGRVPEPLSVYWHNPAVLKATMGLGAKAQKWDACDLSLKSFAHMAVSAQIESELAELSPEEAREYLDHLGVAESGVGLLIRAAYHLLGLRTLFTASEKEARAWTIHAGDTAPAAAGVIHSDFEKGFIKAETVAFKDFIESLDLDDFDKRKS